MTQRRSAARSAAIRQLTLERLKEVLDCYPEAGVFVWKNPTSNRVQEGDLAGGCMKGYIHIQIDGVFYRRHHLIWFFVHGELPKYIDHRNGIPGDDRIENLRLATHAQNMMNMGLRRDNRSGFKGVHRVKSGRYKASISIGVYDTPEQAHAAYQQAALRLYGEFARFK